MDRWILTLVLLVGMGTGWTEIWVWQGTCGTSDWYSTCTVGDCGSGHLFANNWGRTKCNAAPPFPGAGDTVRIPQGAFVVLTGGAHVASLEVEAGGTFQWSAGNLTVDGHLVNHGTVVAQVNGSPVFSGIFENHGVMVKEGSTSFLLGSGDSLINRPDGVIDLQDGHVNGNSGIAILWNQGEVHKTGAASVTLGSALQLVQDPPGTLRVTEGLLFLYGKPQGPVEVAEGATVYLRSVMPVSDSLWVGGTGLLIVSTDLSLADSGVITTALQDPGEVLWSHGDLHLAPGARWVNNGVFVCNPSINSLLEGVFENRGTFKKQGTPELQFAPGSVFWNQAPGVAVFQQGNLRGSVVDPPLLQNEGRVLKTSSSTVYFRYLQVHQLGAWGVEQGTLWLHDTDFWQDSGATRVDGTLRSSRSLLFTHGTLRGTGVCQALVDLQGDTLSPGDSTGAPAQLGIAGSLVMDSSEILLVEIQSTPDSLQSHDQVEVSGGDQDSVVLRGWVYAHLLDTYQPSTGGDSVLILAWATGMAHRGSFDGVHLMGDPGPMAAWLSQGDQGVYLHLADTTGRLGDVNNDGQVDALDVEYLARYLYEQGPPPPVMALADLNGDSRVDDLDLVALTRHLW